MQRLRVLCAAERTAAVLAVLDRCPGATHIVTLPGAALRPAGDVVEASVARESIDGVLSELVAMGIPGTGAITVDQLDLTLSTAAETAERAAPGEGADAVVWDELIARTGEESRLTGTFLAFLTISCLIAAVGAVTDSPVTVVGAMVLGPEFGPLAAIAVGVVRRHRALTRSAVSAIGLGFPIAIAATALGTALSRWVGVFDSDPIGRLHEVEFIYTIGPTSLLIAVLAGAAGMLSLTSARSAALVGVFISVTTVPAAGFAAVAAVLGHWRECGESVAQLSINLVGIVVAAVTVLTISTRIRRGERSRGARSAR